MNQDTQSEEPHDEYDDSHHSMMNGPRIAQSLPPEYLKALIRASSTVGDSQLNEASTLREEEARRKYDERMEELDRRDQSGPHWIYRD